jgi:TatD DNase family protein
MNLIDTHAHIYHKQFDADRDEMLKRAFAAGVSRIYMPNIDAESVEPMLELFSKYPGQCFPMLGIHPCDVHEDVEAQIDQLRESYREIPFCAVGETGLDLYWDKSTLPLQQRSLHYHLQWATEHDLPIVLHSRNATNETIEIVEQYTSKGIRGIFHCFSGALSQAQRIVDMGMLLGIGGVVTFKNGGLEEIIRQIPMEFMVLETDAPFLAPVPHRGKRNSPEYLPLLANKISEISSIPFEEVCSITSKNALRLFEKNV